MTPVVSISVITPKPGQFEAFMELQLAQQARAQGQVQGLLGTRLFRALDGASAVLVSIFATVEDQQRFGRSELLRGHLERVRPLVEAPSPGLFQVAFAAGAI